MTRASRILGYILVCLMAGCTNAKPSALAPPAPASTPITTPPATSVPPVSLSGRIVFSWGDDIFAIDPDGSRLLKLTSRPGAEYDAAWSPDGSRIIYRDSRRGNNEDDEIYVMKADGSGQTDISRDPANDWGPSWSPDGTRIAFNSDRDGGIPQIYVMSPDGSLVLRLTTIEGEYPSWSPDGSKIAFMSQAGSPGGGPGYEIFVMDADGSNQTRLTTAPGEDGWPAWSRDGALIAFSSTRDDHGQLGQDGPFFDIYVMNSDGSNQRRVTQTAGQFVTWSPDGSYILVAPGGYVVRPDGSGSSVLPASQEGGGLNFPDWHP